MSITDEEGLVIESDGQVTLGGSGMERRLDSVVKGAQPDAAKLKLRGASIEWEGPQMQRAERHTLIVDVVVAGVSIEDDLDEDNYTKKTWRVHAAQVESVRLADDDELRRLRLERMSLVGESGVADGDHDTVAEYLGRVSSAPPSHGTTEQAEEPDEEPAADAMVEAAAARARVGDLIAHPPDGEVRTVAAVLAAVQEGGPVRLALDGGEVIELAPSETIGLASRAEEVPA